MSVELDAGFYSEILPNTPASNSANTVRIIHLMYYISEQSHSSVERAALLGAVTIRKIKPDDQHSVRGEALDKQIQHDIKNGYTPFYVS